MIHELNTKCKVTSQLYNLALEAKDNDWITPGTVTSPILRIPVPEQVIKQCSILTTLIESFDVDKCVIFKTPPYALYNWHTDDSKPSGSRTCAINMLIHHTRSSLLLQTKQINPLTSLFYEHQYKQDTLYIVNSNNPHGIINYEGYRYLLSLRVIGPSYEDVVKHCEEHNL